MVDVTQFTGPRAWGVQLRGVHFRHGNKAPGDKSVHRVENNYMVARHARIANYQNRTRISRGAEVSLSDRLRLARLRAGLTQEMVIKELEIGKNTIWRWESGITTPSFSKLQDLADLYEVKVSQLTGVE